MNWVDLFIVAFIIYFLVIGYFQGFLKQFIDLTGLILSFLFAVRFYQDISHMVGQYFNIPASFSGVLGFLLAWFVFRVIYYFISALVYGRIPKPVKDSKYNRFGGGGPALVKGVVVTSIILTLCLVLPLPTSARDEITNSRIGSVLVKKSATIDSYLEKTFGGAINDTLTFFTTKPESDETTDLGFRQSNVSVDETSENRMLELVNEERSSRGLKKLVMDKKLQAVARAHSKDMFEKGYFSHNSQDGKTPFDRMHDAGITFFVAGENLALAPNVDIAHDGLMNSPGHRANILTPEFGHVGIGVIDGGIYGKMFSQEFTD